MNRAIPLLAAAAVLLAGCGPAPTTAQKAPHADPTTEGWYAPDTLRLANMDRTASQLFAAGRKDEAAAIVQNALSIQTRLLAAPRPTLEAMEAIGDLDHIYGHLLVSNGYFGEARMLFQKNVTRWKTWKTPTPETEQRLKEANGDIAECDRHMGG
jgi:hypothetical protein